MNDTQNKPSLRDIDAAADRYLARCAAANVDPESCFVFDKDNNIVGQELGFFRPKNMVDYNHEANIFEEVAPEFFVRYETLTLRTINQSDEAQIIDFASQKTLGVINRKEALKIIDQLKNWVEIQ